MQVHVLTVGTDPKQIRRLSNSCQANGIKITILGQNQKWTGFGLRHRICRKWLEENEIPEDDMVIFTDAYDVVAQKTYQDVLETVTNLNIGDKLLCSAEVYLWPSEIFKFRSRFEKLTPPSNQKKIGDETFLLDYIFPCAGQYCGKKKTLLDFYRTVNIQDSDDDQAAIIRYIVAHPDKTMLDRKTQLFQPNIFTLQEHSAAYKNFGNKKYSEYLNPHLYVFGYQKKLILKNRLTGNAACFLHANGAPNNFLDRIYPGYIRPLLNCDPKLMANLEHAIEVITMPQRRSHVEAVLNVQRIPYTIFPAVIGKNLNLNQLHQQGYISGNGLSKSEIGCLMSHLQLLKKAQVSGLPWMLILEDDAMVSNYYPGKWVGSLILETVEKIGKIDASWDMIYLGRCYDNCLETSFPHEEDKSIIRVKSPLCTHAYIIKTQSIAKILKALLPLTETIDRGYRDLIKDGFITAYASNPPLFVQGGLLTTIYDRGYVPNNAKNSPEICRDLPYKYVVLDEQVLEEGKMNSRNRIIFHVIFILLVLLLVIFVIFQIFKARGRISRFGRKTKIALEY